MSFIGAVASSVRQVLARYAGTVTLPCLVIGAGNFTVPSVLRSGGYAGQITACDVTLYTSALGMYLSDGCLEVRESEDCPPHLAGLLQTESPLDLAASVSLLMDLREVWQGKNAFQLRVIEHHRSVWDELMDKTRIKLETYKKHIGAIEYQARDGFDLLAANGFEHTVFAFPPTYKAGYEKLEALLRAVAVWNPPKYREMTDKSLDLYEQIARFSAYYVVLEKDLPDVYAILGKPSAVLPRGQGRTTFIIAKQAPSVVIRSTVKTAPVGPIFSADQPVNGTEIPGFALISRPQSLRLNQLFLAKRIDYSEGGVDACLALTLDGRIVGKADFRADAGFMAWKLPHNPEGDGQIYLLCDLAVPSDHERRLAKLVLLLLTSCEVRDWLNARLNQRFGWVITTAFSTGPVSMKYRGVFDLYSRKQERKTGRYSLNYFRGFNGTLTENYAIWLKKYHK